MLKKKKETDFKPLKIFAKSFIKNIFSKSFKVYLQKALTDKYINMQKDSKIFKKLEKIFAKGFPYLVSSPVVDLVQVQYLQSATCVFCIYL